MKKIISIIAVAFVAVLLVSCSTKKELDSLAGTRWGFTAEQGELFTITFNTATECLLNAGDVELCTYTYVKPIVTIYPPKDLKDADPVIGTVSGNEMRLYDGDVEMVFKKL